MIRRVSNLRLDHRAPRRQRHDHCNLHRRRRLSGQHWHAYHPGDLVSRSADHHERRHQPGHLGPVQCRGPAAPGTQRSMVEDIVYTFSEPVNILSRHDPNVFTIAVASGWTGTVPAILEWAPVAGSGNTQWEVDFGGSRRSWRLDCQWRLHDHRQRSGIHHRRIRWSGLEPRARAASAAPRNRSTGSSATSTATRSSTPATISNSSKP